MDPDISDIESQTSASAGGRSRPVSEWVGTTMAPGKQILWRDLFGTNPRGPSGHFNPHGMLAAQRFVCEKAACEELLRNGDDVVVADVGGAPHRTYEHLKSQGRYLIPQVHAADRTRRGRVPREAAENVCTHRFEECTCHEGKRHCFLFTHSAYYLDPMWLWTKLNHELCVDAISVEHWFSDMFGGFYGEASWMIHRETVSMTVTGNSQPYIHTLPPWQCGWVGARGEMIEAEVLKDMGGCTRVVRLHPGLSAGSPQRPLIWGDVEADVNSQGPVQFSTAVRNAVQDNARFTQITFDVNRVWKFGPVLYTDFCFRGETVEITVPVNGVAQVAAFVVNRARTPELFTEVSHNQKNRLLRSRIPPEILPQVLTAMVALGFIVNLNNEIDTLHTMTTRFSWSMKAHSVLLQFGSLGVRWWPYILCLFLLILVGASVGSVFEDEDWQRVVTVVGALLLLSLCWCCGRGVVALNRAWHVYMQDGWVRTYADDNNPRVPLLGNAFDLQRNLPLPGSRYVRPCPPEEEQQGFISLGASREREFEPNRGLVSGVVLDGALPNVLATTQAAEESAVTNRILVARENPTEEGLQEYERAILEHPVFTGIPVGLDTGRAYFMKWIDKIRKSYPKQYVDAMVDTWQRFQGVECPPVATKAFLKVEKSAATVNADAAKATKPRLIQPPEDVDKAMTGPAVWQLWCKIRNYWDGIKSPVMYCSGYTCSEIGARVDAFIEEHEDVVAWSVDQATYDATLSFPVQKPVLGLYTRLGMPSWLKSWLIRVRSRGTTPNGVSYVPTRVYDFEDEVSATNFAEEYRKHKFKVFFCGPKLGTDFWQVIIEDFQMTSGRMDTNLTDTTVLVGATVPKIPKEVPFLLLVCGDDGFLMLRKEHAHIVNDIVAFQRSIGLKPEGVVTDDRSKWEFCSKLFWYAVDPATGKTVTVLGSKPFRGIARMGMNTTVPGAANAAAAALSVRIDSGHVPFLGPFADRTYELCKESKMKPTGKPEWSALRTDKRYNPSVLNWTICLARYGLGPEQEEEFKGRLAGLKRVPIVLAYEPGRAALLVDEA